MKKINSRILLIGLFLVILLAAVSIRFANQPRQSVQENRNETVNEPQNITVTEYIETTPSKFSVYKEAVEAGSTALQLLQNTSEVKTEGEGQNAFVVEINGRMADNSKRQFWAFYVNNKQAPVGAGSYILKNGDIIQWKIETY